MLSFRSESLDMYHKEAKITKNSTLLTGDNSTDTK